MQQAGFLGWSSSHWWVYVLGMLGIFILCGGWRLILRFFGIIIIPEQQIGIVTKKFVLFGENKTLPNGEVVALKGEAGIQADTLAPGLHFWLWPWQYEIRKLDFIEIPEGQLGVVDAIAGQPLPQGRVLAKKVDCDSFQDAKAFIQNGGERGPQITIIPPGTYRINDVVFNIRLYPAFEVKQDMVGIVTTKEGKPLPVGEIAGKEIPGHGMYQDGQAFLDNGGFKGLQEQVILAGRYYFNPNFVEVQIVAMTTVPIANVGVVIAYVGDVGQDVTGEGFKHGNMVHKGQKGVWIEVLDPGKYPINPITHKVENVSTANIVLNWATGKTESHKLDEKLSTITVRSKDGFSFNLDVSQIIHIPRNESPKVIARFGSVSNLVTQVLEPTIGNYFRNSAQEYDAIDFLRGRKQRQEQARDYIIAALKVYDVVAVDTLIGDINAPQELMKTLTDRQIAEQETITYGRQRDAETQRQDLEKAKALADTQSSVIVAERSVQIAEYTASAVVKTADGEAAKRTKIANADAMVLRTVGAAEGEKITAVGTAEANVIKMKTEAMKTENYAAVEIARALAGSTHKWVPEIVAGGDSGGGMNNMANILLTAVTQNMLKPALAAPVSMQPASGGATPSSKGPVDTKGK